MHERIRSHLIWSAIALLLLIVLSACAGKEEPGTTGPNVGDELPGTQTGPPPWAAELDHLRERMHTLGLPALSAEGTASHIHQHLDIFVDGSPVEVPAGIGIQEAEQFISPLHTHDTSGIIHVESPTVRDFTLGQFFGVWGVRFGKDCIGGECAAGSKHLRVYVDGKELTTDPTELVLTPHQEIVVVFGTDAQLPDPIPSEYEFPAGY